MSNQVVIKGMLAMATVALALGFQSAFAKPGEEKDSARLDALEADVAALEVDTSTNAGDIAELQTAVGTNAADIGELQTAVGTNTSDIASLQSAVGTNASDIASLQSAVGANSDDIDDLLDAVGLNTTDIGDLKTALAEQLLLNDQLQNKFTLMFRFVRAGNTQQELNRVRRGVRERQLRVQELNGALQAGLIPTEIPAILLYNEVTMYADVAEEIRCSTVDMETLPEDDCILSTEEVIEEDTIEVPENVQVVYEEFTIEYETIVEDVELTLDQAIQVAIADGVAECVLWDADQDNDFKLALCLAVLGVDTAEALATSASAMLTAADATEVLAGEYFDPACFELNGSTECPEPTTGTPSAPWESVTGSGEDSSHIPELNCDMVTGVSTITGSVSTECI